MKSNELEKAFSALRSETHGREPNAQATLARVLLTTRKESKRKLRLFKLWLPLAAVLVASSAWAAADGRFSDLLAKQPALEPTHQSEFASRAELEPAPPRYVATSQLPAVPEPVASVAVSASAAVSTGATGESLANPLALDKAAYEAAFRLHAKTRSGDAALANAAVAAWDDYLARFPQGRFQPEARYARAVALARAGRKGEAKGAMESFAKGDGYRKADAERWIESLEHDKTATKAR